MDFSSSSSSPSPSSSSPPSPSPSPSAPLMDLHFVQTTPTTSGLGLNLGGVGAASMDMAIQGRTNASSNNDTHQMEEKDSSKALDVLTESLVPSDGLLLSTPTLSGHSLINPNNNDSQNMEFSSSPSSTFYAPQAVQTTTSTVTAQTKPNSARRHSRQVDKLVAIEFEQNPTLFSLEESNGDVEKAAEMLAESTKNVQVGLGDASWALGLELDGHGLDVDDVVQDPPTASSSAAPLTSTPAPTSSISSQKPSQSSSSANGNDSKRAKTSSGKATATSRSAAKTILPRKQTNKPGIYYRSHNGEGTCRTDFVVISNDNTERNAVWLVGLKDIFSMQLPKMPKEYIAKLVLDPSHQSLLAMDSQQRVVGGITFRLYLEQGFAEIAFCAVSANLQERGHGARLMNNLKQYATRLGLSHFLTYADNFAIGYFKKQGFTAHITLPTEKWREIKDYEGGTLMECVVHPRIDYLKVSEMVEDQRSFGVEKMRSFFVSEQVFPGWIWSEKASENPYESLPGMKEAGWRRPLVTAQSLGRQPNSGSPPSELRIVMRRIIDKLFTVKDAWPFREPVRPDVDGYHERTLEPMDLSLIRSRIDNDFYSTLGAMRRDLDHMLLNCTTFNTSDSPYHRAAVGMGVSVATFCEGNGLANFVRGIQQIPAEIQALMTSFSSSFSTPPASAQTPLAPTSLTTLASSTNNQQSPTESPTKSESMEITNL